MSKSIPFSEKINIFKDFCANATEVERAVFYDKGYIRYQHQGEYCLLMAHYSPCDFNEKHSSYTRMSINVFFNRLKECIRRDRLEYGACEDICANWVFTVEEPKHHANHKHQYFMFILTHMQDDIEWLTEQYDESKPRLDWMRYWKDE